MNENNNILKKAIIKKNVTHQSIGGKEIIIEKEFLVKDILDTPFDKMPIAMYNFILRRLNFIDEKHEYQKAYYGHVGNLGYFIAEDEIERWEK